MDDCLDMLNLMGKGDISKEPFDEIIELCLRCSRGSSRNRVGAQDVYAMIQKLDNSGAAREKVGNLFKNLKIDIMHFLSSQLDVL